MLNLIKHSIVLNGKKKKSKIFLPNFKETFRQQQFLNCPLVNRTLHCDARTAALVDKMEKRVPRGNVGCEREKKTHNREDRA